MAMKQRVVRYDARVSHTLSGALIEVGQVGAQTQVVVERGTWGLLLLELLLVLLALLVYPPCLNVSCLGEHDRALHAVPQC